jgi:hypothetical protein
LVVSEGGIREVVSTGLTEEEARVWKRRRKAGVVEVGDLIKVKGEIQEKWKIRRILVMKLGIAIRNCADEDIVTDQNVESKAWEERVRLKRTVLSKPWKLSSTILSEYHKKRTPKLPEPSKDTNFDSKPTILHHTTPPKPNPLDFTTLPPYLHSIRNLKLFLLSKLKSFQTFTLPTLLSSPEILHAATCVTRNDTRGTFSERDIRNTLQSTVLLLLGDGNVILSPLRDADEQKYITVGPWNLGATVRGIAKREGKVVVRDIWRKVGLWGNGWAGVTKGVIGSVVEEVLTTWEGQEWVESKAGVWTRLDV